MGKRIQSHGKLGGNLQDVHMQRPRHKYDKRRAIECKLLKKSDTHKVIVNI